MIETKFRLGDRVIRTEVMYQRFLGMDRNPDFLQELEVTTIIINAECKPTYRLKGTNMDFNEKDLVRKDEALGVLVGWVGELQEKMVKGFAKTQEV